MKGIALPTWQVVMREAHDYFMITIGLLCYAIGWILFLLPNDITTGGVAGVASLVYFASSHAIPVQYVYFGINAFLLMLALKIMGFRFSLKTIFAVFMLTFLTSLLQKLTVGVVMQIDPFMASVIGAFFCGTGIGLAFISNGS
ncbi:MAG: YitT family protein, partial [Bacteroidales bacterium]|nr:YitT family protein [Bacteroidales bacterium]